MAKGDQAWPDRRGNLPDLETRSNGIYTLSIYICRGAEMSTYARVFQSGNSQAVRLPKEFRFDVDQVEIFRRGDEIVLRASPVSGATVFDALVDLPEDILAGGREDAPPQRRDPL